MSPRLRIDFVAPPFAGHLYPLLQIARGLKERGFDGLRVLSTASAMSAIESSGLEARELLPGGESTVQAIANPGRRVGSNPFRLLGQFRLNLQLMPQLRDELLELWREDRPDLVFADFTVPIAGLTAQREGIAWWSGTPSPCVFETGDGVPAYLGGWTPRDNWWGRTRDRVGRGVIRTFKGTVRWLCSREFDALSIPSVYRDDGLERVYSPTTVLAFGLREFEFERDWPPHLQFIGPLTQPPQTQHDTAIFEPDRKHVLLTLGTHVHWARRSAESLIRQVALKMPECVFHCSRGIPDGTGVTIDGNVHTYDFLPYTNTLERYGAAIIHGGTGIVYACIEQAVPSLVWPQDFDQFDHAARVVHHGLGLPMSQRIGMVVERLRFLLEDEKTRKRLESFQEIARRHDPMELVVRELARQF